HGDPPGPESLGCRRPDRAGPEGPWKRPPQATPSPPELLDPVDAGQDEPVVSLQPPHGAVQRSIASGRHDPDRRTDQRTKAQLPKPFAKSRRLPAGPGHHDCGSRRRAFHERARFGSNQAILRAKSTTFPITITAGAPNRGRAF